MESPAAPFCFQSICKKQQLEMKQLWQPYRMILTKGALVVTLLTLFIFLLGTINPASAETTEDPPTLTVHVRHPDGRVAEGIGVDLYVEGWLPEEEKLAGSCEVPESGICQFNVQSLVQYAIRFPDGHQLDPITAFAAGHSGINGLGIVIKDDYTIGFVLSKLNEVEAMANWMLIDETPESEHPTPIIPDGAKEEVQKMLDVASSDEEEPTLLVVTQTPAGDSDIKSILIVGGLEESTERVTKLPDIDSEESDPLKLVSEVDTYRHEVSYSDWFYRNYPWILLVSLLIGAGAAYVSGYLIHK